MSQYSSSLPWSAYETMNTFPGQWDLNSSQSEQQIIAYYNSLLERQLSLTNDRLTKSGANPTAPRHSVSSTNSLSPRSSKPSAIPPSSKPNAPSRTTSTSAESSDSKEERRRSQNRASQRAYRDRKDKQLKALEAQIAQWQSKHQGLCSSYTKQTSEVRKLKAQIEELTSKIIAVQTGLLAQSPLEFDMGPGFGYCDDWETLG